MNKEQKRERPFFVNESDYPFEDHWLTRDKVAMHFARRQSRTRSCWCETSFRENLIAEMF